MWTIVKTPTCFGQCMSIIRDFKVFLTETALGFVTAYRLFLLCW
jgi:hypothetical protein